MSNDEWRLLRYGGETFPSQSMSETAEIPEAAAGTSHRSRRRRKRRAPSLAGRKWLIGLGITAVAGAAAVFSFTVWLDGYLKSDAFRTWISGRISERLKATAELRGISWRDTSAFVETFRAVGGPEAAFGVVTASDIRADIDAGAIWDRTWEVESVKVARAGVDFTRQPDAPPPPVVPAAAEGGGGGFLSSLIPDRTVVKLVRVDQFGFDWKSPEGTSAAARNIMVEARPSEDQSFLMASGSGGTLVSSMLPGVAVEIESFDASWQDGEVRLDRFQAEASGGARLSGEATVRLGNPGRLDAKGELADLSLDKVVPDDWLKRVRGTGRADVRITGNPADPGRLMWRGEAAVKDGMVEGLPVLQIIARKTRNESFVRLVLREARTRFTRTGEGDWMLDGLHLDAPGLLRLKGRASVGAAEQLSGALLLGIVPGTLRYLAGAEQEVFLPMDRAGLSAEERSLLGPEDAGLLWTRLTLGGTLTAPSEDLSDRLARAWFNATVDEVLNMSMEGAAKAAEVASKAASGAAEAVIENAPAAAEKGVDLLQKGVEGGAGLLQKGAEGGLRVIEGLLPK